MAACGDHRGPKVRRDGIVVVHGDGGRGTITIGDGAHIASLVDKAIALLSLGHQVDHCCLVIGKHPLSRGGDRPSSGAGDGDVIYRHKVGRYVMM